MSTEPAADAVADWTEGTDGLALQHCDACGSTWYFQRRWCPRCGAPEPTTVAASGAGTVRARTEVHRAPTPELKALAPYTLVLVDLDEGVRVMGHGGPGVAIGDAVAVRFVALPGTDRSLPRFEPADEAGRPVASAEPGRG